MPRSLKKFICEYCGEEFETRNWKKNKNPKFCSKICYNKSMVKHPNKKCKQCEKEFKPKKEESIFCSKKCFNEYKKSKRMSVICDNCGKKFFIRPSDLKYRNARFCSIKCRDEFNKAKILEKACPTCGKKFTTPKKDNKTFCSNECSLKSLYKKELLSKKYSGKTLIERGFSEGEVEKHKQRTIIRNKENAGKTYKEIYGEDRANEISQKLSEIKSGISLYSLIMKKHNVGYEEARKFMPAYGRNGEEHPMFGKHHSVESKQKMMDSFYKNGKFGRFAYGVFNGVKWQGSWELKYLIDCYKNGIKVERWQGEPILYYYENKPHHYFPDFITEGKVVEIKGLRGGTNKVDAKTKAAQKLYGDKYIYINNIEQPYPPKVFYSLAKEKYSDILEILYNPHEEEKVGS